MICAWLSQHDKGQRKLVHEKVVRRECGLENMLVFFLFICHVEMDYIKLDPIYKNLRVMSGKKFVTDLTFAY